MGCKRVSILGVTGSVGQSAADIILSAPDRYDVDVVTAHRDVKGLAASAVRLRAKRAVIADENALSDLRVELSGSGIEVSSDIENAVCPDTDLTIAAILGVAGLRPLMHAIEHSAAVAIANKEPLVAAGAIVMAHAKAQGCQILPIDSEHNAVFQVFDASQRAGIERIILTASGGPFRAWSKEQMASATLEQALKHPNWDMGQKITIDSATMMNKGLEVIEAHHLFDMSADKIDVIIHPQSTVHSMVEYVDGSVLAQMGASDMRTPIAYALGWPERIATPGARLDLKALSRLDFEAPDTDRFPALSLAYDALRSGPCACIALNAANEVAVEAFLKRAISFPDIVVIVQRVLDGVEEKRVSGLEEVLEFDHIYKAQAQRLI